jgi:hypothetical protein
MMVCPVTGRNALMMVCRVSTYVGKMEGRRKPCRTAEQRIG